VRFISEHAEITYDTCAMRMVRGQGRNFSMMRRLLPYDAIKQNIPRALSRMLLASPAPDYAAPPLRVNDVTIMSPSRIITIAADTDLYNFEAAPPDSHLRSPLASAFPNCTSFSVARHFPNPENRRRRREGTGKDLSNIKKTACVAYRRDSCRVYFFFFCNTMFDRKIGGTLAFDNSS